MIYASDKYFVCSVDKNFSTLKARKPLLVILQILLVCLLKVSLSPMVIPTSLLVKFLFSISNVIILKKYSICSDVSYHAINFKPVQNDRCVTRWFLSCLIILSSAKLDFCFQHEECQL